MMGRALACGMLAAMAACGGESPSAGGREVALDSADVSLDGLDPVSALFELPDGRLLMSQPGVPAVTVLSLDSGEADTLGRAGDGPGEYRWPADVFQRGGRYWVMDAMQQRLTSWLPDGSAPEAVTYPVVMASESAVDTLGGIYYEQPTMSGFVVMGQEMDSTRSQDSTYIYRFAPPDTRRDTVGRIFEVGWETVPLGGNGVARMRLEFETPDVWGVLPDGTVWIARGREHRVDLRRPDGSWQAGVPRPWAPIPTTEADRRPVPRFGPMQGAADADTSWLPMADEKGPFQDAVAAPDGEVWTRLHQPAGFDRERYAVFPPGAASTLTVSLPLGRRIVLISERWVYTRAEDADGLMLLSRYARP